MADEMTLGGGLVKISSMCPFASLNPGGALKTFYETILITTINLNNLLSN